MGCVQARFEGDISTWGHGRNSDDSSGEDGSLSSGLSPREAAIVRGKQWDQDAGLAVSISAYSTELAAHYLVGHCDAYKYVGILMFSLISGYKIRPTVAIRANPSPIQMPLTNRVLTSRLLECLEVWKVKLICRSYLQIEIPRINLQDSEGHWPIHRSSAILMKP